MHEGHFMIIAIDGPAGAGKSTVAKELAQRLGISYLDTGAMYRALTLKALRQRVNLEDGQELITLAQETSIDLKSNHHTSLNVLLDNEDVTEQIRSQEVTNNTFYIARVPGVREILVKWQRKIGEIQDVIAEGRDVGTVVFPQATRKFYLDAKFEERAKRRIEELRFQGKNVDDLCLKKELKERDEKDLTRSVGPLKKADYAVCIDSTHLSIEEVVEKMCGYLNFNGSSDISKEHNS